MSRSVFRHRWYWVALALYAGPLLVLLLNHEPWRDEMQAWLLARDSASPLELWRNTRYEGHPLLWHLLLWLLSRWSQTPLTMQLAHGAVAVLTAGVFLAFAPFPRWLRVLWVFGYFPLFEYGVISRNYGLTVLFLFLALALRHCPFTAAAALVLAAHASPMGVLLAPVLALVLLGRERNTLAPLLAFGFAWGLAVFSCLPPADYEHARGVFWQWDELRGYYVLRGMATAFLPLFRPELHFWNNPMLFPFPPRAIGGAFLLAALIFAAAVALAVAGMRGQRRCQVYYLVNLTVLLAFFYVKFPGATRHHGFVLIWTVVCLWLHAETPGTGNAVGTRFLALAAVAGFAGALPASWVDLRWPFSSGRTAAQAVAQFCGARTTVAHPDWAGSTVAAYLPRGAVFYPTTNATGSFVVWNLQRAQRENLSDGELVATASQFSGCLLLNRALLKTGPCTLVAQLPPAVVMDEQFWLYRCWP